jgi:hypothetical protein
MKIINQKREENNPNQLTEQDLRKLKVQIEIDGFEAMLLHYISYCVVGGSGAAREVFSGGEGSMLEGMEEALMSEFGFGGPRELKQWVTENLEVDCQSSVNLNDK